jgi:hypothetical protein
MHATPVRRRQIAPGLISTTDCAEQKPWPGRRHGGCALCGQFAVPDALPKNKPHPGGAEVTAATSATAPRWSARTRSYKKLAARCRNKPQIVTAIGRELLGFIWAIAVHTEARAASSAAA